MAYTSGRYYSDQWSLEHTGFVPIRYAIPRKFRALLQRGDLVIGSQIGEHGL